VKSKGLAISADQLQLLIGSNAGERTPLFRVKNDSGVNRELVS
jgi:hypothetical protein